MGKVEICRQCNVLGGLFQDVSNIFNKLYRKIKIKAQKTFCDNHTWMFMLVPANRKQTECRLDDVVHAPWNYSEAAHSQTYIVF